MADQGSLDNRLLRLQACVRKTYEESGREKLDQKKLEAAAMMYAEDQTTHHSSGYQSNDSAPEESNEEQRNDSQSEFMCAQVSETMRGMYLEDANRPWHEEVDDEQAAQLQNSAPAACNGQEAAAFAHWTTKNAQNILLENRNEARQPSLAPERPTHANCADEWSPQTQACEAYQLFGHRQRATQPTTVFHDRDGMQNEERSDQQWRQTAADQPVPHYTYQERRQIDEQPVQMQHRWIESAPMLRVDCQPQYEQQQLAYEQQQFADEASQPLWRPNSDGHGWPASEYREPAHEESTCQMDEASVWNSQTMVSVATALHMTRRNGAPNEYSAALTSPTPSATYDDVVTPYTTEYHNHLLKSVEPGAGAATSLVSPSYQAANRANDHGTYSPEYEVRFLPSPDQSQPAQAYLLVDAPSLSEVDVTKPPPPLPHFLNSANSTDALPNSASVNAVCYVHQTDAMQPSSKMLLHSRAQYDESPLPPQQSANFHVYAAQRQSAQSMPAHSSAAFCASSVPDIMYATAPQHDMRYVNEPLPPSPPHGATPDSVYSEIIAHQQKTSEPRYAQSSSFGGRPTILEEFQSHIYGGCISEICDTSAADCDVYVRDEAPTFDTDYPSQESLSVAYETTMDEFNEPLDTVPTATPSPPLCATAAQTKHSLSSVAAQTRRSIRRPTDSHASCTTTTPVTTAPEYAQAATPDNSTYEVRSGVPRTRNSSERSQMTNGVRRDSERGGNPQNSAGGNGFSTPRNRRQQQRHSGSGGRSSWGSGGTGSGNRSIKQLPLTAEEENRLSQSLTESYGYSLDDLLDRCFGKFESFSMICTLRSTRQMFEMPKWTKETCADLAQLKDRLNEVKERLNSYELNDWHRHTRATNPADMVMRRLRSDVKVEFLTQAWCKFYELMHHYELVPRDARTSNEFHSVHLCEAPGAFVASLNHYLRNNYPNMRWTWKANSLNPYYEGNHLSAMINDDRFMLQTIENWDFGPDMTGNILHPDYPDHLRRVCNERRPHLVTADGSFDCQDKPEEQEKLVSWLHLKEALTAIRVLRKGGHFVIKMFTFFECESVCLLFLLQCVFQRIDVMKPATSKEGNSEVYVVCREFKDEPCFEPFIRRLLDIDEATHANFAMFPFERIPRPFIRSVLSCATRFAEYQIEVIERNIRLYQHERYNEYRRHFAFVQEKLFERYVEQYDIKPIPLNETVVRMPHRRSEIQFFASPKVVEQREHKQGSHEDQLKRSNLEKKDLVRVVLNEVAKFPHHQLRSSLSTVPKVALELHDFKIEYGKPIDTITSSQFCHGMLIRVRNELMCTITHKQYYIASSDMEKSVTMKTHPEQYPNLCDFASLLMNMKNHNDTQRDIFKKLFDRLASLDRQNLTLFCFPLLTQFNVSVLCILNQIFKEIQFEPPNILYLCNPDTKSYESWMPKLAEIDRTYTKDRAIISFLPIKKITGSSNQFYSWVIEANNAQIIREIDLFSSYHS